MSAASAADLADLPGQHARALIDAGQARSLPARSTLCEEGKAIGRCFLVTAGSFAIVKRLAAGPTTLWTVGPGALLAAMPAFDGGPCAVTIAALDDATVVEITQERLRDMVAGEAANDRPLAALLARLAIGRLRETTNELAQTLSAALQADDSSRRADAVRLARIQAASYAWPVA